VANGPVRVGEVIRLGRAASVQFASAPILFRVIRVRDWKTYDGWLWLDGYELDNRGEAVERRSVFIMVDGIERGTHIHTTTPPAGFARRCVPHGTERRTARAARHRVARQRQAVVGTGGGQAARLAVAAQVGP
jgi:hypothetical protein